MSTTLSQLIKLETLIEQCEDCTYINQAEERLKALGCRVDLVDEPLEGTTPDEHIAWILTATDAELAEWGKENTPMTDMEYAENNEEVESILNKLAEGRNISISYKASEYLSTYFDVDCEDEDGDTIESFTIRVSDHKRNPSNGPVDYDLRRGGDLEFWLGDAMSEIIEKVYA
jgi:hypothetical protein